MKAWWAFSCWINDHFSSLLSPFWWFVILKIIFVGVSYGCWPYQDLHPDIGFDLDSNVWNSIHSYFLKSKPLIICGPRTFRARGSNLRRTSPLWIFSHNFDQWLFKCACLLLSWGKGTHSVWHGKVFPFVSSETVVLLGTYPLLLVLEEAVISYSLIVSIVLVIS